MADGGEPSAVAALITRQRAALALAGSPPAALRRERLAALQALLDKNEDEVVAAVAKDFGVRSPVETRLTDLFLVAAQIALARRRLGRWMRSRHVPTPLYLWPGRSRIIPQPLGVVGVIGAWNYPVATLFAPMVCALAAGNSVILKPSEQAPRTAETLTRLVAERFDPAVVTTICGGPEIAAEFSGAGFDHLFFTGSGGIGRHVATAAAATLTPVTLELGGKSPGILDPGCDLPAAAGAIAFGKFLNAGQTCVGVDYILAPEAMHVPLAAILAQKFTAMFPNWPEGGDYTDILSQRHFDRLQALLDDAVARGAKVVRLASSTATKGRSFPPTLLFGVNDTMRVMNEEIFGPLLPVVAAENADDAIAYVAKRDKPLALYWFGRNRAVRERIIAETFSGGVTINGAASHVFHRALPFGGVGPSGNGAYFGEAGFRRFSKDKAVFIHGPFSAMPLLAPPYSARTDKLLRIMRRVL